MPTIPASKPADGMSATSGPLLDEPHFGSGNKEEQPLDPAAAAPIAGTAASTEASPAAAAAPAAAPAAASTATPAAASTAAPAVQPTPTEKQIHAHDQ